MKVNWSYFVSTYLNNQAWVSTFSCQTWIQFMCKQISITLISACFCHLIPNSQTVCIFRFLPGKVSIGCQSFHGWLTIFVFATHIEPGAILIHTYVMLTPGHCCHSHCREWFMSPLCQMDFTTSDWWPLLWLVNVWRGWNQTKSI